MTTITLTKENAFSKLSKIMSLLEKYNSIELSYKKKELEVIPYPEDSIAYDEAKKRLDAGEFYTLDDIKKLAGSMK